ncbi:MAG TPA: histidine kinase dimerization/phospho-acceptor domain-containing protein, partial [Bdellovibrionales bacterium]|nr:histidine kinase dimerization/phospho-acceptor domain-containing protein [Bdellovibrionales bacterium]
MPTTRPLKILLVEDNEFDLELILRELKTSGLVHQARAVDTLEQFDFEFKEFQPDIILCDFSMPGFDAFAVLSRVTASGLDIPVIIITGTLSDETAVECLKRGAADYLLKDKIIRLRSSIERALELRDSKTERQRILSRLSENEEQLRTITNVLPALLLYITPTLQIQFTNRTSELWLDSEQSAFIGNSVAKMLGDEFARRFVDEMPLLMQGVPVSFETFLPTVSGSKFVNTTITPDPGKSRGIKGFVCLITDISERKRYEQELLAARSAADSANKSKSLFLANMSHEMRTPLSAMMGFAELLLSKNESASDRTLWAEKIHKNCERLKNMIDEILDLSKIEAGKTQIEKSIFPVADVIAQVQSLLGPIAKEKGIQLVFSVKGKIPERICSDQTKLRHVLTNIIG